MNKSDSKKSAPDLKKYQSTQSLSLRQMSFGLWLSKNRAIILRIITIILIVLSFGLLGYSGYNYSIYFLYGRQADKELSASLINNLLDIESYREANAPQVLLAGPVYSFGTTDKRDFLLSLKNPNDNYYAIFDYCLQDVELNDLVCDSDFILPGSEKYLLALNKNIAGNFNNLNFEAVNVFWRRLNVRQVPNWDLYASERLNIEIKNVDYKSPDYSSRNPLHSLSFQIENKTAYNFSQVPLSIVLWNNNSPAGVNIYNLNDFMSADSRDIKLSWPASGERANKADIFVDLNIFDSDIYLPYSKNLLP